MQYRSKGIIIKTQKLSEADRILKILTEEHGLVSAVAKGARRSKSSFAAKAQSLNKCDFLLAEGKSLDVVSELSILQKFNDNEQDILSLYLAFLAAEICEKVSFDEESSADFFYLLEIYLDHLKKIASQKSLDKQIQENQKLLLSIEFLWCIVCELGYKPELNFCSLSNLKRKTNQIPQHFDLSNGSICSRKAYELYLEQHQISEEIIPLSKFSFKLLEALDKSPLSNPGTDIYLSEIHSSDKKKESYQYRKVLIEEFLVNYLKVSLENQDSIEQFSMQEQNLELKASLKLLYKHIRYQTQINIKSWASLVEIL